jgi:hypothetical protein
MTDRELLESAAKAAGIPAPFQVLRDGTWVFDEPRTKNWNPLTDDGDALRLAVKLEMRVVSPWQAGGYKRARADHIPTGKDGPWVEDADPYAATRRAIVRAAAEIGRSRNDSAA